MWGTADGFHFASQTLSGDGQIIARLATMGAGAGVKVGVMMREALTGGSKHVLMAVVPGGHEQLLRRRTTGGATSYVNDVTRPVPVWLKLVRQGTTFTGSVSANGTSWTVVGSTTVSWGSSFFVGLAVASQNPTSRVTATFDNVSVQDCRGRRCRAE
jgi:hypothetical protein